MNIDAVLFDLDGTLYKIPKDFDEAVITNIYRFYRERFALNKDEEVKDKMSELKGLFGSNPRAFYYMKESKKFFSDIYSGVEPSKYVKMDERLVDMMRRIRAKKAILTNGPDFFVNRTLQALGISGLIDCVEYGNTSEPKPSLEGFLKIMKKLGVKPGSCLMIGDNFEEDIVPAQSLGMKTALISDNGNSGECDLVLGSIYELEGVLHE